MNEEVIYKLGDRDVEISFYFFWTVLSNCSYNHDCAVGDDSQDEFEVEPEIKILSVKDAHDDDEKELDLTEKQKAEVFQAAVARAWKIGYFGD